MARGDQVGRQWKIIQTLISSKTGKSAADLANDLECNPRTIYRDLEALQVAGFPIYTERVDGKNLWSLVLLSTIRIRLQSHRKLRALIVADKMAAPHGR